MNKLIIILIFSFIGIEAYSQGADSLLKSIELNNPLLRANTQWLESEKARSRTGLYPENPDITFNYLWGTPDAIGNQKELEITQRLRFPSYYFAKSSMQKKEFSGKEISAEKARYEILYKARNEIASMEWLMKKQKLLEDKMKEASELLSIMQEGYNRKEFSKPAFDKVRIYYLNNQTELSKLKAEITVHREILRQLNGDQNFNLETWRNDESNISLPSFESLQSKLIGQNPDIRLAGISRELAELNLKVENQNRLPKLEAGYKGETILNQSLRGIHTGISVPLWENKNRLKQARIAENFSALTYDQVVSENISNLRGFYTQAEAALRNYREIKSLAGDATILQSTFLLLKAGEISFPEYLAEVQLIYENQLNYLESERDFIMALNSIYLLTGEVLYH
jgi:outer membrane protein TolC